MTLLEKLAAKRNLGRTILFETVYGSKLYGCDLPGSDHDIRGVFMPGTYDMLRSSIGAPSALTPDSPDIGTSEDNVYFPDATFVSQVLGMKNNCVEIFFAAYNRHLAGERFHPAFELILEQKDALVTSNASGFIGHARQRCSPYIKGEDPRDITMQANKLVLEHLKKLMDENPEAGAWQIDEVDGLVDTLCEIERVEVAPNKQGEDMLYIHTRQANLNTRIAELAKVIEKRLERFNKTDEGISDKQRFKDLSTSLRMLETCAYLMEHGTITFPIPTAQKHRDIRKGAYEVEEIIDWIDAAQEACAHFEQNSPLREPYSQGDQLPILENLMAEVRLITLKNLDINL